MNNSVVIYTAKSVDADTAVWHLRVPPSRRIKLHADWLLLLSFRRDPGIRTDHWSVACHSHLILHGDWFTPPRARKKPFCVIYSPWLMLPFIAYHIHVEPQATSHGCHGYFSGYPQKHFPFLIQFIRAHAHVSLRCTEAWRAAVRRCLPVERRQEDGTALDGLPLFVLSALLSF